MGSGSSTSKVSLTRHHHHPYESLNIDSLIGEGGYSKVYHGTFPSSSEIQNKQQHFAIKLTNIRKYISPPPISSSFSAASSSQEGESHGISTSHVKSLQTIINELEVFKRIRSISFTVALHAAFRYGFNFYFVMDCLPGGDLRRYLRSHGPLNEESVVYVVGCIGSALHHIHERGVIHRDIKPENIGLDSFGRPFLTDFGISIASSVDNPIPLSTSSSGTLPYLAPEVLAPGNCHSYQSDYWSLGVLAYELLFDRRPFPNHCPIQSIQFVSNEFGWIWSNLLLRSRGVSSPTTARYSFDTMDSPKNQNQDIAPLSPKVNFADIVRPHDWKKPFPDLSSSFSDSFPSQLENCTQPNLSEEVKSLLRGLLDLRFSLRLGNLNRYDEFSSHPSFALYGYSSIEFSELKSPLDSQPFQPMVTFSPVELSSIIVDDDDNHLESLLQPLKPKLRNELLHFSYLNLHPAIAPSS